MNRTLLIGYGNTLRGDDGAGVQAAKRAAQKYPGVDVVLVHELQPELAETLSRYTTVLFLDAAMEGNSVSPMAIEPASGSRPDGSHAHSPGILLALCRDLYGNVPKQSWLIAIPGQSFEFGEHLSVFAEEMVERAIEEVGHFLTL